MKKQKKSRFWLLIFAVFFVYFAYVMIDQQKVLYSKDMELSNIQAKIKEEERLAQALEKQKETLESDEYIEKIAREKLGMVKSGEKIFVDINK